MSDKLAAAIDTAIKAKAYGRFQLKIALLCAVVTGFDGYDISSAGIATPALADAWKLHPQAFTSALVWGSIGLFLGAMVSGPIGDRFGRKRALVAATAVFGAFSLLCALAASVPMLTAMRFGAGLGLGAAIPLTVALVSDYTPSARHGQVVASMATGFPLGAMIGGLAASQIVHQYGWQSIFVIGGLAPLLYVPVLLAFLPESAQFLARREGLSERVKVLLARSGVAPGDLQPAVEAAPRAAGNPVFSLFRDGMAARTLLLWLVLTMNFLVTYLLLSWLPSLFHTEGLSTGQSILATTLFQPGGLVGGLLIGWFCDRFGSEASLICTVLIGALFVALLGLFPAPFPMTLLIMAGIGFGIGGSQMSMNALAGALYPPTFRATGVGWALGVGRLGNIFGPFVGGIMLSLGWAPHAIILTALAPALVAVAALTGLGLTRRGAHSPAPPAPRPRTASRPV